MTCRSHCTIEADPRQSLCFLDNLVRTLPKWPGPWRTPLSRPERMLGLRKSPQSLTRKERLADPADRC
eukprot:6064706-Pleurochrysis_carterae.AAC.1